MTLSLTIPGAARTKKAHSQVVSFGRPCVTCGKRPHRKLLPSKEHEKWFGEAMTFAPVLCRQLRDGGAVLPIEGPVEVKTTFYRERAQGDNTGFQQALGDWLQEAKGKCVRCKKISPLSNLECQHCGGVLKESRKGAGIIQDDAQIVHWDAWIDKDKANPRIEVEISTVRLAL